MRSESLGLLVPAARDTMRLDPDSFVDAGVAADGALHLGPVLATPEGVLQRVSVAELLGDELRRALYRTGEAA
jgi:chemotaxis-related protein WspB